MAFPPEYPYPVFLSQDGDRFHPGTTWFAGTQSRRPAALRNSLLWRVGTPIGYPDVLYLFSLTDPAQFVPLNEVLAERLVPIELARWFQPYDCRHWYNKFAVLGAELWASQDNYGVVTLNARSLSDDSRPWVYEKFSDYDGYSEQWQHVQLWKFFNKMQEAISERRAEKELQQQEERGLRAPLQFQYGSTKEYPPRIIFEEMHSLMESNGWPQL